MKRQARFSRSDLVGSEKGPSVILLAFSIIALLVGSVAVAEDLRGTLSPDFSNGTCSPSATTLCLNDNRFSVAVSWQVQSQGRSGQGMPVPLSSDTGLFWFFDDSDIDLVVKVLDGTDVNRDYWVFYAGLSNVAYRITVMDSRTGRVKSYDNPNGTFASFADTSAFSDSSSAAAGDSVEPTEAVAKAVETRSNLELYALFEGLSKAARVGPRAAAPCVAGSATLCLAGSRFQLTVDWHWQASGQGQSGHGTGVPLSSSTGYFWFSNDANVELMVKILDARAIDGHFWVFAAALSNVEYTLTVTDTQTGLRKAWENPEGQLASWADTGDFSDSPPPPPPLQGLSGTWTGTLTVVGTGRQCEGPISVDLVESDGTLTGQFDTRCGFFSLRGVIEGTALSGSFDGPDGQGQISRGLVASNWIQFQSSNAGGPSDGELIEVSLSSYRGTGKPGGPWR
jgi:hypothetical protein